MGATAHLSGNVHRHCLMSTSMSRKNLFVGEAAKYTSCHVPCPRHRADAIVVPVESRRCHRALQLFSCPWLCHRACANVPVPGPSCPCHRARAIMPAPLYPCHRSTEPSCQVTPRLPISLPSPPHCGAARLVLLPPLLVARGG